jgi:hypothetical protein
VTQPGTETKREARFFKYTFTGGRAQPWAFTVPVDQADSFLKRIQGTGDGLLAEVLVTLKQGVFDHGRPSMSGIVGPGSEATTGAGRALVAELLAWRVKSVKTDEVFVASASSGEKTK